MTYSELDHILDSIWDSVELGATLSKHPFRRAVLATFDGVSPQMRTVILRYSNRERRCIQIYSDLRSTKIQEISEHPKISLLFYDQQESIQIRLNGTATVESGGSHLKTIWAGLPIENKINYATPARPGSQADDPVSAFPVVDAQVPDFAFKNFSVITLVVDQIDWLRLGVAGHYRAKFQFRNNGFTGGWVVP